MTTEETARKVRNGRELFLRREAGEISERMSSFVRHADEVELPITPEVWGELLHVYEWLRKLSRGEELP